ncbi:MAG: class I SAM-dependent methyltransferase, partial [Alphaproteobacteria bacterium]|nr:class I SAM-dependent methyltransferase [Alphaproteobacteria bacterium]
MADLANRLAAVLDHLNLEQVFLATQMPGDIAAFSVANFDRIAGVALIIPSRINPAAFARHGGCVMVLAGESGIPTDTADAAAPAMPDARQIRLAGYAATAWSDIAVERPDTLCQEIERFFSSLQSSAPPPLSVVPASGMVEGVTYRVMGAGPPLVLTPFFLAASQWEPVLERLTDRFTVIILGGAHIGGVAMLEDRASLPSYGDMLLNLLKRMDFPSKSEILEVGCGPAALCRRTLAAYPQAALTGLDANGYLLREGAALASAKGLDVNGPALSVEPPHSGALRLTPGDATNLPFADNSFDAVYSITVLEECDADKALA